MIELETERLILRQFRPMDIEVFSAIYGDPEIMRYMGGGPKNPSETAESIQRKVDHWAKHGYGLWCLEMKDSGRVVGHCGLGWLEPLSAVEVAFLIDKRFWRQGLATEAVRASLAFGFEELRKDRIVGITLSANHASRRVMEKSGLLYAGDTLVWGKIFARYSIDLATYKATKPVSANPNSKFDAIKQ